MNFHPVSTRVQPARRIPEILDGLKAEYDTLLRDTNVFAMQRDEYEKQLEYHRQEAQRIQDQLFELEHYHKDIVSRYQEEIEYLKRQLEMAGHDHDTHQMNKYETKQRVVLPSNPLQSRSTAFSPNLQADAGRVPSSFPERLGLGGLPGVLSSLKNQQEPSNVITGVVASVVGTRGGPGTGSVGPRGGPPGTRPMPGGPLRGVQGRPTHGAQPGAPGVIVVGAPEGGEESYSNVVIEEQDIVMASVNPGDK